jgi:hypothetical protein
MPAHCLLSQRAGLLFFAAGLLLSAGCGLQDYEAKMAFAQEHIEYLDKENQVLEGKQVLLPVKKDASGKVRKDSVPGTSVFFRPPKGIRTNPETGEGLLATYPAQGKNVPFQDVLIAVVQNMKFDTFKEQVLSELQLSSPQKSSRTIPLPGGKQLHFDSYTEDQNGLTTRAYFYNGTPPFLAALVFRSPSSGKANTNVQSTIDLSLGTLLLGVQARIKLSSWNPTSASAETPKAAPQGPGGRRPVGTR